MRCFFLVVLLLYDR